jgi:hypothetical protein
VSREKCYIVVVLRGAIYCKVPYHNKIRWVYGEVVIFERYLNAPAINIQHSFSYVAKFNISLIPSASMLNWYALIEAILQQEISTLSIKRFGSKIKFLLPGVFTHC